MTEHNFIHSGWDLKSKLGKGKVHFNLIKCMSRTAWIPLVAICMPSPRIFARSISIAGMTLFTWMQLQMAASMAGPVFITSGWHRDMDDRSIVGWLLAIASCFMLHRVPSMPSISGDQAEIANMVSIGRVLQVLAL